MSKAFTKESDDAPEDTLAVTPPASASLPPGTANHMTPDGARRLREELERLTQIERPALAGVSTDDPAALARRRKLNGRIAELTQILGTAEVVPPPTGVEARPRVVFGAAVTVREVRTGEESRYQIVGVDEVDFGGDRVSLYAPVARVLINARVGERVRFRFPAGEEELEVVAVDYDPD